MSYTLLFAIQKKMNLAKKTSGSGTTSLAWTYMKVCGYSDSFLQKLEPKVIDP